MKGAPCPVCRGPVRVEMVYDSGLGYSFLHEYCDRCGVGSRRRTTMFEGVHLSLPKGFYSSVLSAADLRPLAPVPGVCVKCDHPWLMHVPAGCEGQKLVRTDIDGWEYHRCYCGSTPE